MKRTAPFARATQMMALVSAAVLAAAGNPMLIRAELAKIGPYESRGKGGKRAHSRHTNGASISQRAARKARNVQRYRASVRRAHA